MGAADGNFCLLFVVHAELVSGFEPGNDFANLIDVDDETAVSAPEERGVELIEELLDGAALRLTFELLRDDANDSFADLGETDLCLINEEQAASCLNDELGGLR